MSAIKKTKPRFRVGDSVTFLFGSRQITGVVIEDRGPLGAHGRRIFLVRVATGQDEPTTFEVPEDNLEEPSQVDEGEQRPGARVEFSITYVRRRGTSTWQPTVKRGQVYQGVRAKGAVAYSTARREGESQDDETHGTVTVFLEPRTEESESSMAAEARRLADRMFLNRHPNAEIED
jgi:hypothetical protein